MLQINNKRANNIENMILENPVFTMLSFKWLSYGLTSFFDMNILNQNGDSRNKFSFLLFSFRLGAQLSQPPFSFILPPLHPFPPSTPIVLITDHIGNPNSLLDLFRPRPRQEFHNSCCTDTIASLVQYLVHCYSL